MPDAGLFKMIPALQEGIEPGMLIEEVGTASFTTTGTSVEIRTQLSQILGAHFTLQGTIGSLDAQDTQLQTDGVITSGAVTVERPASGLSGLTIYYRFTGYF